MADFANPFSLSYIEGKIQTEVAKLLLLKEPINSLRLHNDPNIAAEAAGFYAAQTNLEARLQEVLGSIETMKTEGIDLTKLIDMGTFAYEMETHIGRTQDFIAKATGTAGSGIDWAPYLLAGGLVIGAYALFGKKRK